MSGSGGDELFLGIAVRYLDRGFYQNIILSVLLNNGGT